VAAVGVTVGVVVGCGVSVGEGVGLYDYQMLTGAGGGSRIQSIFDHTITVTSQV
jgi:hypothetical protein